MERARARSRPNGRLEIAHPWPVGRQPQDQPAALSQGPPGCVLEGKAQPLGLSGGKGSLQAERPGPGHQVLGDEDQLQPGGVGGEALGLAVEGSITR